MTTDRRAFLRLTGLLALAGVMPTTAFPAICAPEPLSLFQFDECDWVAAPTREAAIAWYTALTGIKRDELEVDECDLDATMTWGEPGDEDAEKVTFAEAIKRMRNVNVQFPEIVASTEF